jgi:hypothetical protein
MTFKRVRPGLYERVETPRTVKITTRFADAIRRDGNSSCLETIVDQTARESDRRAQSQSQ